MPVGVAINEKELVDVRAKFDSLLRLMEKSLQEEDRENLDRAYNMAVDAHKYQRRKSGEPYIFHPIEVARICFEEIGLGPTAVVCALLHDVVEDTPVECGKPAGRKLQESAKHTGCRREGCAHKNGRQASQSSDNRFTAQA